MVRAIRPSVRFHRRTETAARLVRLFSMGATLLYPLVGVATAQATPTFGTVVWAVVVGILFHVYADVGNDVMDAPIDQTDRRRMSDPLIRGSVSAQMGLGLALTTLPLLLAIALYGGGQATGSLVAAVALIGAYNLGGKAFPLPIVADVVQGVGWGFLVIAGAKQSSGITSTTCWAAAVVVVYVAMVNGVHGAIRDAENDSLTGARTTALILGVRVLGGGWIRLPARIVLYGATLQLTLGVLMAGVLATGTPAVLDHRWLLSAVSALGLYVASSVALGHAYDKRDNLRMAMAAGTWHLFLLPASLMTAAIWRLPAWAAVVTVVMFVTPPVLFGWAVRGTEFGVPRSTVDRAPRQSNASLRARLDAVREMSRLGTPLAAAALTAVGGIVAGGLNRAAAPAMAATGLAVVAANVFNDRCDLIADGINRPDRPIPAGAVTANDADRVTLTAALATVVTSTLIDAEAALAASLLLSVALWYSLALRRLPLLGHAAVAVLFAAPLLFGGWVCTGGLRAEHWIASALVMLYVFARETLKGVPDRAGDVAAGYRTIATEYGEGAALSAFRAAAVAFCVAALVASLALDSVAYLAAVSVCAVIPTMHVVRLVRGSPAPLMVDRAISSSGFVFASGMIPLLMMR